MANGSVRALLPYSGAGSRTRCLQASGVTLLLLLSPFYTKTIKAPRLCFRIASESITPAPVATTVKRLAPLARKASFARRRQGRSRDTLGRFTKDGLAPSRHGLPQRSLCRIVAYANRHEVVFKVPWATWNAARTDLHRDVRGYSDALAYRATGSLAGCPRPSPEVGQ